MDKREALSSLREAGHQSPRRAVLIWVQDWVQLKKKSGVHSGRMRRQTNEI
jgi:hypothetical protein